MADYLAHHGVKGMKWGVRRYQNADGTRTALGKKRERKAYTPAEKAKRRATAKKVAVGIGAATTVAVAGYMYVKHKDAVDAFIKAQTRTVSAAAKGIAGERAKARVKADEVFVAGNKAKVLNNEFLFKRYYDSLTESEQNEALRNFNRRDGANKAVQKRIRAGGDYINAVMGGFNAAAGVYNFKNQQIVKDAVGDGKKK